MATATIVNVVHIFDNVFAHYAFLFRSLSILYDIFDAFLAHFAFSPTRLSSVLILRDLWCNRQFYYYNFLLTSFFCVVHVPASATIAPVLRFVSNGNCNRGGNAFTPRSFVITGIVVKSLVEDAGG